MPALEKPALGTLWAALGVVTPYDVPKQALGFVPEIPDYDNFNWLMQQFSQMNNYINEQGVPAHDTTTTYFERSLAKGPNGNVYRSLADDNLNHAVTDTDWWVRVTYTQAEIVGMVGAPANASELVRGILKLSTTALTLAGVDDETAITPLKLKQRLEGPALKVARFTTSGVFIAPRAGTYYISGCGGGGGGGVGGTAGGGGSGGQALDFPVVLAAGESVTVTIGGVSGTTTFGGYLTLTGGLAGTASDGGNGGTGPINGVKGGYRAAANIGGHGGGSLFGLCGAQSNGTDTIPPSASGYGAGGGGKSNILYQGLGTPGFIEVKY